jgi:hypothetical protein
VIALDQVASARDEDVIPLLAQISPAGTLEDFAESAQIDRDQAAVDTIDAKLQRHLDTLTLAHTLEDELAVATPAIVTAAGALEEWVLPLLSALAGPAAPLVSLGVKLACVVAGAVLSRWAAKRLAAEQAGA